MSGYTPITTDSERLDRIIELLEQLVSAKPATEPNCNPSDYPYTACLFCGYEGPKLNRETGLCSKCDIP